MQVMRVWNSIIPCEYEHRACEFLSQLHASMDHFVPCEFEILSHASFIAEEPCEYATSRACEYV